MNFQPFPGGMNLISLELFLAATLGGAEALGLDVCGAFDKPHRPARLNAQLLCALRIRCLLLPAITKRLLTRPPPRLLPQLLRWFRNRLFVRMMVTSL